MNEALSGRLPQGRGFPLHDIASHAFSRAAGASLIPGNAIRLLKNGAENYPAWLAAMRSAERLIHFESYIIHEDDVGREFAEVLKDQARKGIHVRLVYDWMGGLGKTSGRFWRSLREEGVEVRCFNPLKLREPLGWIHRDHRKSIVVDNRIAFVMGLCVGKMWVGDPEHGIDPWRDTGVEVRGPAVVDVAQAFAEVWAETGDRVPVEDMPDPTSIQEAGDVTLRVVADTVFSTSSYRLDTLVAALAKERLWLTDAYLVGTPTYVQALRAAAQDGVDIRLLVPGEGSDMAIMQAISRAGYRPLLEAGVRVFEWNGSMMHAKTALADTRWARVGSTNLNVASWLGNWELDVIVEDKGFGEAMEQMYLEDLDNSTEIVLKGKRKVTPVAPVTSGRLRGAGGSAGRVLSGAARIGNVIGAVITAKRDHGPAEASLLGWAGVILVILAIVAMIWPKLLAYPLAAIMLLIGVTSLTSANRLRKGK